MEALPLARVASEFLPKLDRNVGVGKRRDESMSQAVEAPRRDVAPSAAVFGFAGDPGGDSRTLHDASEGHARARLACNGNMRKGGKQRSVIACPGWVLEQKSFDFGVDWQG